MKRVSSQGRQASNTMAFSTCGVVYSVAVIRLVGFFFSTNYNSIYPPGPSCTKVFYIMGPVSLAFFESILSVNFLYSFSSRASNHQIAGKKNPTEFTI